MKKFYGLMGVALSAIPFWSISQVVTTFDYTGSMQTYVVPVGVTSIDVDVMGAEGGHATGDAVGWSNGPVDVSGGDGGRVTATLSVTPGETLYIFVGGQGSLTAGGFNGGGDPASCSGTEVIASGGGGASDIRQGGTGLAERVVVAGGGGGGSGSASSSYSSISNSGAGGDLVGASSQVPGSGSCLIPSGGTQSAGGNGGNNSSWCGLTDVGGAGTLGQGGSSICVPSGLSVCTCSGTGCVSGGGGGGGYYGGGAGLSFASGGGGSSYTGPGATGVTHYQGTQTGNGQIIITVNCSPVSITASATTICSNELLTLSGTSANGGNLTWDLGVMDNTPFQPDTTGLVTYTVTSDNVNDCANQIDITVLPLPEFTLSSTDEISGSDGTTTLTIVNGLPPYTFDWNNDGTGDFDDSQNLSGLSAGMYIVVVQQSNGCSVTDSIAVDSQLGLDAAENGDIIAYPNPVNENLYVNAPQGTAYQIFDILGNMVAQGSVSSNGNISFASLTGGSYTVVFALENTQSAIQVLKQ